MKNNYTGKKWCKTHPISTWAEGFRYCSKGYKTKDCVDGRIEEKPKSWGYLTQPI